MHCENKVTRRQAFTKRRKTPASLTDFSTPFPARSRQERDDAYHTVVWGANLFLVTIFPVLFVFGTVVPILSETVPFLASRCPVPINLTPVIQLLIVAFLAELACQYYALQLPMSCYKKRTEQDKWCRKCKKLVAHDATHCKVCSQCTAGNKGHCFFLSVCIGRTNISACRSLLLELMAGSLAAMVLLILEASLSKCPRTSYMMFFLCAAIFTEHLAAIIDRSPVQRAYGTSTSSSHKHKE